jgi:cell division protein FtsB
LREVVVLFRRVAKKDESRPARQRAATSSRRPAHTRRIVHLLLIFVASVIVVDALVGDRGLVAMLRARHEYDELSGAVARQRAENARLRETARRLREDPSAIEEIARRELGLIKPGERVFIVKDLAPPAKP